MSPFISRLPSLPATPKIRLSGSKSSPLPVVCALDIEAMRTPSAKFTSPYLLKLSVQRIYLIQKNYIVIL